MVGNHEGRQYRVLGTIGKGGFGTVYKAELLGEGGFSKVVALKVLNPDVAGVAEVAQRLRDEARVLGLIHHRAIVQVDGLVQLDGRWTIVMECVTGVDLKRLIALGPIPEGPALEIVAELATALRVAFEQIGPDGRPLCMLHRDLKPSNLQLTAAGEVKVLDFGTARANFGAREAKTESLAFGTIDYMSPERLEFEDSAAGDVYAMGVILFEMLTGEKLGRTSPRPDKHHEKRQYALRRVAEVGAHEGVLTLLGDMLAFAKEDRPTARDVEQRTRQLRAGSGGPWLSDWASEKVPALLADSALTQDEMTGATLSEGSSSRPIPVPRPGDHTEWIQVPRTTTASGAQPRVEAPVSAPRPRPQAPEVEEAPPSRSKLPFVVVGLLGLGALAVVAGLSLMPSAESPAPALAAPAPTPAVATPAPAPAPTPELEPAPAPAPAPEPVAAAPSALTQAPEPGAPTALPTTKPTAPKPAKAKPKLATVSVEGEVEAVSLIGSAGRFSPGPVPAGSYTIEATFTGRGVVKAGNVTVPEAGAVTLVCQRAFARCTAK